MPPQVEPGRGAFVMKPLFKNSAFTNLADVYLVSSFGARRLEVMEDSVYPVWCRLRMRPACSRELSNPNGYQKYFQQEKVQWCNFY